MKVSLQIDLKKPTNQTKTWSINYNTGVRVFLFNIHN